MKPTNLPLEDRSATCSAVAAREFAVDSGGAFLEPSVYSEVSYQRLLEEKERFELPLLSAVDALADGDLDFSRDFFILGFHLLLDNVKMLDLFLRRGAIPGRCYVLGKPYSANIDVLNYFLGIGAHVHKSSLMLMPDVALEETRAAAAAEIWAALLRRGAGAGGRIFVFDDGGIFFRAAAAERFRTLWPRVRGVEQTSRGAHSLAKEKLRWPVVNVARSRPKLDLESPYIARCILSALFPRFRHLFEAHGERRRALVLGHGAIGRQVHELLRREGIRSRVYDPRVGVVGGQRPTVSLKAVLPDSHLVIGCSGVQSLSLDELDLLPDGAIVASGSSSDVEFAASKIRRRVDVAGVRTCEETGHHYVEGARGERTSLGHPDAPARYTYPLRMPSGGRIFLVDGGCPVNFRGDKVVLPAAASQLTVSLMALGMLQVARERRERGLRALNPDVQSWVEANWMGGAR